MFIDRFFLAAATHFLRDNKVPYWGRGGWTIELYYYISYIRSKIDGRKQKKDIKLEIQDRKKAFLLSILLKSFDLGHLTCPWSTIGHGLSSLANEGPRPQCQTASSEGINHSENAIFAAEFYCGKIRISTVELSRYNVCYPRT